MTLLLGLQSEHFLNAQDSVQKKFFFLHFTLFFIHNNTTVISKFMLSSKNLVRHCNKQASFLIVSIVFDPTRFFQMMLFCSPATIAYLTSYNAVSFFHQETNICIQQKSMATRKCLLSQVDANTYCLLDLQSSVLVELIQVQYSYNDHTWSIGVWQLKLCLCTSGSAVQFWYLFWWK